MSRRHPHLAVLMAVLAVTALAVGGLTGVVTADSDADALTLGADIRINNEHAVDTYDREGVVSRNISFPQMRVIIGEDRGGVGLGFTANPLEGSTRNDFIRITHSEEIGRTVRIPISAGYWKPFPREELESVGEDHTAKLEPVTLNGKKFTMMTVRFTGRDSAVFAIPEDAVAVYSAAQKTENRTNSTFGVSLGLTPTPWSYVASSVLSGNKTTVRIEGNPETMMIQYNAGTADDPMWLTVPDGEKRNVPVYRMERDGVDGAVYVVSTTTEPPELRYKTQSTLGDRVSSWTRSARHLPEQVLDGLGIGVELPFTAVTPGVSA